MAVQCVCLLKELAALKLCLHQQAALQFEYERYVVVFASF